MLRRAWSACQTEVGKAIGMLGRIVSVGLFCFIAEEGNEVVPVLALLQATESHLGAWYILFGILKIFKLTSVPS